MPWLMILSLLACNNNASIQEENDGSNYTIKTNITHREYLRYGETDPFMNEYGRVIQYTNNDTIILEYCKDSTSAFVPNFEEMARTNIIVCDPRREVFMDHSFQIEKSVSPVKKTYKKNYAKGSFNINENGKDYQIFRLKSILSKDIAGDTVLMHSNEYWNEDLGLILKMDENFGRQRRRIIKLVDIKDTSDNKTDLTSMMDRIYQDSTEWIIKDEEGKTKF